MPDSLDLPLNPPLAPAIEAWRAGGHYFQFGEHQIFARQFDNPSAPTLVLLHGFPTASWDFKPVIPALRAHWQILTCDLLGFGLSDKPTRHRYRIAEQCDLVERFLQLKRVGHCAILAHDYGVTVAQELLARQRRGLLQTLTPSRVCFLNGGLIPGEHRPRLIQRLLASPIGVAISRLMNQTRFEKSFAAVFAENSQPTADELAAFWSLIRFNQGHRIGHRLIRYMQEREQYKSRWVGELRDPLVPLRFICGLEDPVSGAHMTDVYQQISPDADIVRLAGVGHYPQCEAPTKVARAVIEFLAPRSS